MVRLLRLEPEWEEAYTLRGTLSPTGQWKTSSHWIIINAQAHFESGEWEQGHV